MHIIQRGMLLVLSGPSGAGKGTLGTRLLSEDASFRFSVSATTRKPRPGETDGVHYHFWDVETFESKVREGAFLECATVHGNRYGTLRASVEECLARGENILLDIDVQGGRSVSQAMPESVSVFILPPSMDVLYKRLRARNTDDDATIARRMRNAEEEIAQLAHYQYALVNDDIDCAYDTLRTIIAAEKQRTTRFFPPLYAQ